MTQTKVESSNQHYRQNIQTTVKTIWRWRNKFQDTRAEQNIQTTVKTIWRWRNKFQDTRAEQGITFTIPQILIEITPVNSSTR